MVTAPQLRLYIAGATARSSGAVRDAVAIRASYTPDGTSLEVIDVYLDPDRARADAVWAVPTLIADHATGPLHLVGDTSDHASAAEHLGLVGGPA